MGIVVSLGLQFTGLFGNPMLHTIDTQPSSRTLLSPNILSRANSLRFRVLTLDSLGQSLPHALLELQFYAGNALLGSTPILALNASNELKESDPLLQFA